MPSGLVFMSMTISLVGLNAPSAPVEPLLKKLWADAETAMDPTTYTYTAIILKHTERDRRLSIVLPPSSRRISNRKEGTYYARSHVMLSPSSRDTVAVRHDGRLHPEGRPRLRIG